MKNEVIFRNSVKRFGNGKKTIMFAHGYGCDQNMWRFITPSFQNNYDCIIFDHVGSGNSDEKAYDFNKYDSLSAYANDIISICDELGLRDIIFVGHSVGSMMGALAAAERPDLFDRLIMIGPSPRYINDEDYYGGLSQNDINELMDTLDSNFLGWSSYITPVIIGNPDKVEFSTELDNSFCRMNPEIAKHFAKVTFLSDNREDLPRVLTPTLIIQCHPDVIAPIEVGKYVHEHIPNSSYTQIAASGHCPHLTAPELTIKALKSYLENIN